MPGDVIWHSCYLLTNDALCVPAQDQGWKTGEGGRCRAERVSAMNSRNPCSLLLLHVWIKATVVNAHDARAFPVCMEAQLFSEGAFLISF